MENWQPEAGTGRQKTVAANFPPPAGGLPEGTSSPANFFSAFLKFPVNQYSFPAFSISITGNSISHRADTVVNGKMIEQPTAYFPPLANSRSHTLDNSEALDKFLAGIQARAFRIAKIATGNTDDALDLVQDSMFKLVEKYSDKPENEWAPLFYRILNSRIHDLYRRSNVRNRYRSWLGGSDDDYEDPIQTAPDTRDTNPESESQTDESIVKLESALTELPPRQQQAFLLRAWEGLDVRQTAAAMDCAEGSVKTHYSRAIHSLRASLGEHWS